MNRITKIQIELVYIEKKVFITCKRSLEQKDSNRIKSTKSSYKEAFSNKEGQRSNRIKKSIEESDRYTNISHSEVLVSSINENIKVSNIQHVIYRQFKKNIDEK